MRPDFARLRSDDYPIRLWTVAVFVFGVLPLVRKRGLGRIVIGCEHDTTRVVEHEGIPHYDGLYDQSRSSTGGSRSTTAQRAGRSSSSRCCAR